MQSRVFFGALKISINCLTGVLKVLLILRIKATIDVEKSCPDGMVGRYQDL